MSPALRRILPTGILIASGPLTACSNDTKPAEPPASETGEAPRDSAVTPDSGDTEQLTDSPTSDTGKTVDSVDTVDTGTAPEVVSPFTLVLLPDTQHYVESAAYTLNFEAQTRWVVENHEALGIAFVSQLGDIVSHGGESTTSPGNEDEWARANTAMTILDEGGVPWATAVGNHELDEVDVLGSGYTAWAARFGPDTTGRFAGTDWFGGNSHNELNSWQVLRTTAGTDLLLLHLELDIPDTAIAWAEGVMSAHPGWPTVVSTHSHLGPLSTPYLGGDGRNNRDQIREKLLGPNPQIFLLVNGHHGVEEHTEVLNDDCHPVLEMSLDYSSRSEGGMGWLGLLEVDPAAGTLTRSTYSPVLDAWEEDEDSAFTLTWDWEERFSGKPATGEDAAAVTVDDYSADTTGDYSLSDSYGSGGSFVILGGELLLRPAAQNTVAAVLTAEGQRMEVGERWGVRNPAYANVMFMVSSVPRQPDGADEYGFRFRRDPSGLRVESYDAGVSLTGLSADPGGSITLWIERQTETVFEFSVSQEGCGGRTVIETLELPELAGVPSLYVGMQAWHDFGGVARFDDLRVVEP